MASTAERVRIRYRRPPGREDVYEQILIARTAECVITLLPHARTAGPSRVGDQVILEPGAPIVWFAFAGQWYDVGRFHTADGTFQGFYSDIIEPVSGLETDTWTMTDLFLDVWIAADGEIHLLDEDELAEAVREGWIDERIARRTEQEGAAIVERARRGEWPPPIVLEWTLERALATIGAD